MANTSGRSGIYRMRSKSVINSVLALTEQIRITAYALYESRGREDGHDLDDWLCAERQILTRVSSQMDR